jgi:hypothetical protein
MSTLLEAGAEAEDGEGQEEEVKLKIQRSSMHQDPINVNPFTLFNPNASRKSDKNYEEEKIYGFDNNVTDEVKANRNNSVNEGFLEDSLQNERLVREFCGSHKSRLRIDSEDHKLPDFQ